MDARVNLYQTMLECGQHRFLWLYDGQGILQQTNCPAEYRNGFSQIFETAKAGLEADEYAAEASTPVIMSTSIGILWIYQVVPEDVQPAREFVLGPFLTGEQTAFSVDKILDQHRLSLQQRKEFHTLLEQIPIVSFSHILEYAMMLHVALYNSPISVADIRYLDNAKSDGGSAHERRSEESTSDVHGTYRAEQEMLQMVRSGDVAHCQEYVSRVAASGSLGKLTAGNDMFVQMKRATEVCIILFSRAAIEGGLSPETALSLSDRYYQNVEQCKTLSDLSELSKCVQMDFVERVHQVRTAGYSSPVSSSISYITEHLEEDLTLAQLAAASGYAESHFSRRFKQETGKSPFEYIQDERLSRAAELLLNTTDYVRDISERLRFCSHSYFCERFRKKYGLAPGEYRSAKKGEGENNHA